MVSLHTFFSLTLTHSLDTIHPGLTIHLRHANEDEEYTHHHRQILYTHQMSNMCKTKSTVEHEPPTTTQQYPLKRKTPIERGKPPKSRKKTTPFYQK